MLDNLLGKILSAWIVCALLAVQVVCLALIYFAWNGDWVWPISLTVTLLFTPAGPFLVTMHVDKVRYFWQNGIGWGDR